MSFNNAEFDLKQFWFVRTTTNARYFTRHIPMPNKTKDVSDKQEKLTLIYICGWTCKFVEAQACPPEWRKHVNNQESGASVRL